jgi:hypothetical protein
MDEVYDVMFYLVPTFLFSSTFLSEDFLICFTLLLTLLCNKESITQVFSLFCGIVQGMKWILQIVYVEWFYEIYKNDSISCWMVHIMGVLVQMFIVSDIFVDFKWLAYFSC